MKNINKKIWIVLGIILSVCFIFIGTLTVIINGDKICKNTYINDTNIGELTKEQASEKLKNIYNEDNIEFKYNDKKFIVLAKEIDFYYDIDNTVEQAYGLNRKGSFIDNLKIALEDIKILLNYLLTIIKISLNRI